MPSKSARTKVKREGIDKPAPDSCSPYPPTSKRGGSKLDSGPHSQSPAGPPKKKRKTDGGTAIPPNRANQGSTKKSHEQHGSGTPSQPQKTKAKSAQKEPQNENFPSKKKDLSHDGKAKSPHPPVVNVVNKTSSHKTPTHKYFDKESPRPPARNEAMQSTLSQNQSGTPQKKKGVRPDKTTVQEPAGAQHIAQMNKAHSLADEKKAQSDSLKAQSDSPTGQSASAPKMATCVVSGGNSASGRKKRARRLCNSIPINLRPITRLWALEHLKGLTSSNPKEPHGWFNVRALSSGGMGLASPEDVVKMFQSHTIFLTDLLTLDLGWPKGEWMVRIIRQDRLLRLIEKDCFADGVLVHADKSESGFDYLISRLPTPEELQADAPKFPVPVVLMGIPYYCNPQLELDRYLYESITAQNKPFGIEAIAVQQRYQIGPTRTNDVRCHLMIDSKALHRWELNRSMRLTVQGWDSAGVPRPELWSVSMRHIDECAICGGYYHQSENSAELKACEVTELLEKLSRVVTAPGNSVNESVTEPGPGSIDLNGNFSAERIEAVPRDKTSIGFLVA